MPRHDYSNLGHHNLEDCPLAIVLLKRLAYSAAVTPRTRRKERRIVSADLKPQMSATCFSPREELSMICCAASTRIRSTNWPGFIPVSRRQIRVKWRGAMPIEPAGGS